MIMEFVDLKPGDWLMQNGANSAVGQNVIQLAKIRGFKTVNVIRDRYDYDDAKNYLLKMGADIVIKEEELRKRDVIDSVISRAKIRLALNCVGGKKTSNMLKFLADDAQIITYGAMAKEPFILPTSALLFKGLIARGFWISKWHQEHPEERVKELKWLCQLIHDGTLKDVGYEEVRWGDGVDEDEAWARVRGALGKIHEKRTGRKIVLVNYHEEDLL
jgi:NADPH:quinone reductase-like Zn-dependent oxidoreductase